MLSADGWVTGAAEVPGGSAPQARCPEGGARCRRQDLHLYLHHPYASTCGLLLDTALQVQTCRCLDTCSRQKCACHLMTSSPPSLATSGKPLGRGQAPSAPRVPAHIGPTHSTSTDGLQHLTGQPNRPPPSVPRWLKNYTVTADLLYYDDLQSVTQTRTGIYACTHSSIHTIKPCATEAPGQRELLFELGGGLLEKCVSHILFPISLCRQDFSLCCFLLEPETTGWALCQVFIFPSVLHPPFSLSLLACICFIAFPSFPHAITVIFPFPPSSFSCTFLLFHWFLPCSWPVSPFSLCLISSVLSNGSLGSFPHTVSFFPESFHPTMCLFSFLSLPLPYSYTWGRGVIL